MRSVKNDFSKMIWREPITNNKLVFESYPQTDNFLVVENSKFTKDNKIENEKQKK